MNWRHETWRKLYCREEGSFAALSYSARALAAMLLKQCDNRGRVYARTGEDMIDGLCFRMGADRGERRMIRKALLELVADGYLLQGEGWLRIKNFHHAQGRIEVVDLSYDEPVATVSPSSTEGASTVSPSSIESVATEHRPSIDGASNELRPCNEERVKTPESFTSPSVVPSVPFLPEVPSLSGETARARDPVPLAQRPDWRSGYEWCRAFGLAWNKQYGRFYGNASDGVAQRKLEDLVLAEMPDGELAQLWQQREDFFQRYLTSRDERLATGKHPFALFVSRFSDYRPDLKAIPSGAKAGKACSFHMGGRNQGKRAPKPEFRHECPECKHVSTRASPRPASAPDGVSELLEVILPRR